MTTNYEMFKEKINNLDLDEFHSFLCEFTQSCKYCGDHYRYGCNPCLWKWLNDESK